MSAVELAMRNGALTGSIRLALAHIDAGNRAAAERVLRQALAEADKDNPLRDCQNEAARGVAGLTAAVRAVTP